MALTLNTLDQAYDAPDAATVAKTLADLDGKRNLVATLARGESTYLQASGSATSGLILTYQEGSVSHRYRSADKLPLPRVTDAFHRYLRGEEGWRDDVRWVPDEEGFAGYPWYESWWFYVAALTAVIAAFVWWRGW